MFQPDPEDDLLNYAARIGATPELTTKDLLRLKGAVKKVHELMKDGQWHTASSIIEASGIREGLRRLRELRDKGKTIERKHLGNGEFSYKMS